MTASGEMLKPLVVFKGKPGARIETREFPTYPAENAYACQESAWMDERVMLLWVRTILKPFLEDVPIHVQPLLVLDSYRCHTMASVTAEIEALGVQIEIIPGGCTGMCQPIDVGIGKPLKSRARHQWEEWMIAECEAGNASRPASRLQMSQWIADSVQKIRETESIVWNSWRHHEFSFFPNETVAGAVVGAANGGGEDSGDDAGNSSDSDDEESEDLVLADAADDS